MNPNSDNSWSGKTRGGTSGYLFFIFLIKAIGIKAGYAFLWCVVPYFVPFAPKATASVWHFARKRLGYGMLHSVRFLFLNYYRLGQTLIDKVAIGSGKKNKYSFCFSEAYPEFLRLLDGDTGVIMIGAHIGNWETGAPFFEEYGKKMNIVMFDAEYRRIKKVLEKNTDERNYKVIPVNEDSLMHVFKIKEALDQKEYVCFQGDRYVGDSPVLRAEFLGEEASFPAGPFLLASRMAVPVVFYFAMREKGMQYRFCFFPAAPVRRDKGGKPEQELLRQYVGALETMIQKYPEQWFNYYDFWK